MNCRRCTTNVVEATTDPSAVMEAVRGRSRTAKPRPRQSYNPSLNDSESSSYYDDGMGIPHFSHVPSQNPATALHCVGALQNAVALSCPQDKVEKCLKSCNKHVKTCQSISTVVTNRAVKKFAPSCQKLCTSSGRKEITVKVTSPCIRSFTRVQHKRAKQRRWLMRQKNGKTSPTTSTTSSDSESSHFSSEEDDASISSVVAGTASVDLSDVATLDKAWPASKRRSHPFLNLTMLVGDQEFYHSSRILGYKSSYLEGKNVQRGADNSYFLDFSAHSQEEWKIVLEFLQPRSLAKVDVSFVTMPTVLPWFAEFSLRNLLNDVDQFLIESAMDTARKEPSPTLANVLLLANISYACGLEISQAQARLWLIEKLQKPLNGGNESEWSLPEEDEGLNIDWELKDLTFLCHILAEFEELRDDLWESSIIVYLPHDLHVNDSLGMVSNPLFPYLLREGMMQLSIVCRAERVISEQERESDGRHISSCRSTLTTASQNTIPTNHVRKDSHTQQNALSQDLLQVLLQSTYDNLVKFQREQEYTLAAMKWKREQDKLKSAAETIDSRQESPTEDQNKPKVRSSYSYNVSRKSKVTKQEKSDRDQRVRIRIKQLQGGEQDDRKYAC